MEQARQRIEVIKQQQRKRMRESNLPIAESGGAHARPQYLIALGGIAVGLMIAAVIWLTKPLATEDEYESNQTKAAEVITSAEIKKTNDNIARLNHHVEMLSETITNVDAKFKSILVMAESMADVESKNVYTLQELSPDPAAEDNSGKSRVGNTAHEMGQEFAPTHVVNARINLRSSMSLDTTPIAVLDIGTKVEYISETDGWYYVNTRSHGKGWCSSEYLSSLQGSQQDVLED
jgi:hypothetical protein